ncbi:MULTISPECIES: class I SAM-dependent methyltransferase [Sphingomonas]|uniref:SAM-dependent methyltransferase n=1 Tax=Edaphosphingomonas fennica TaxID=114404 RepID=A0A2T4HX88_9SPHN|nr:MULTISPECIES: class I SAM-dependent methyltransferase [Sphingomonas]MDX3885545.1 class I SAM-dependent methyltransferase [Sphingomonas sp.]PTD20444.1 SAM-dependent methyltransferase [Sphingomonas fennica]
MRLRAPAILLLVALAACTPAAPGSDAEVKSSDFPAAHRPVAPIVSNRYSNEDDRDRLREADNVMTRSGVVRGMTVADIGAGEGYYTIRLASRVGEDGRVLAEDIVPEVRDRLAERVNREAIDNVSVKLGEPADPKLPEASFDRIFLVHMYHEIGAPYEFLWRMRPALRPGGRVVVVDSNRPTAEHGTPPALLDCEMAAVGYARVGRLTMPSAGGYMAMYEARGERPRPSAIKPCILSTSAPGTPAPKNPHDR